MSILKRQANERFFGVEVLGSKHERQGATVVVGKLESRAIFESETGACSIHVEGSFGPFLEVELRGEEPHAGVRHVISRPFDGSDSPE